MTHDELVVEFDRPVEEVFAYVDDDEKVKQWVGGLIETKRTTPGKPGVGSKFHQKLQVGKRIFEIDGELLAYEPNRSVKVKLDAGICEMEVIYTFEGINGRTRLTYMCDSYYRKLLYRLLSPLTRRMGLRKLQEDFARLKNLLSTQSHSSTPVSTVGLVNSNKMPERA